MGKSKRKQESKEEILENGQDEIEKKETDKPKQKKMKKHSESNSEDKSSEVITNPEGKKIKKKKKKTETENSENSEDTNEDNQEEANTEEKEPSKTAKKEISKRQQKKAKQLAREEAMKVEAHKSYAAKAMNYVSKWKHAKSDWKFEKLRQQWLINNLFDVNSISDAMYPTVLEYFEDSKGLAREQLKKKGEEVIKKIEDNPDDEEAIESDEYKRARLLLQSISN